MEKLKGKTALITGGSSGIGEACAQLFMSEGANVIIASRNEKRGYEAEERLNRIADGGVKAQYVKCDVTNASDIDHMKCYIDRYYPGLDILVNNAGILRTQSLDEISEFDFEEVFTTDYKAVVFMCQKFMYELVRNKGVVLNISSNVGLHSYIKGRRNYLYASAKSALIQFTKLLARNYGPDVRVNCLCPGTTETNIFINKDYSRFEGCNVMGRIAHPEEIAKVATFLVSNDASFMTGSVVVVDGGESLL